MLKNSEWIVSYSAILVLFILSATLMPAEAAKIGFDFHSTGSDGSTAAGFVEWDTSIAPDSSASSLIGVTQFSWIISGGVNDSKSIMLTDLDSIGWFSLSDGLQDAFYFNASNTPHFSISSANSFVVDIFSKPTFGGKFQASYTNTILTPQVPITTTPVPPAIIMYIPGLIGVISLSRHRKKIKT